MIKRYSREILQNIWTEKSKFEAWLEIEILALEGYSKYNKDITADDISKIRKNAKIDIERIYEIEAKTKHDVLAFTRSLSENLGPEKKWIHYGLTSTDVVDSAQSIRVRKANLIILDDLNNLLRLLKKLAIENIDTYQIGRTHGIHAEVTTFGYTFALWYDEINRNIKRFKDAAKEIEVIKISGAVGNYANIPLGVQEYIAKKLNMNQSLISTQVIQRDIHANYFNAISLIGSSLDKFATNIRHLQRTEVNEVQEGFSKGQKGSSAMPHKKNPIGSENISGLSRVLKGYALAASNNIALWHERDISHSSVERIIMPDATILIDYMLNRFTNILKNLNINKDKMLENIDLTYGAIFSQKVMLYLINKNNISREEVYDKIQILAKKSIANKIPFKDLLLEEKLLTSTEIDRIFNLSNYSKNILKVFKNLKIL